MIPPGDSWNILNFEDDLEIQKATGARYLIWVARQVLCA